MKTEIETIEPHPWSKPGSPITLITVRCTPNWFEENILRKKEYLKQFYGHILQWYTQEGNRCDTETEWWLHTAWANWIHRHGI